MTRPFRIGFPGAVYLVMSRGQREQPVYEDEKDREVFLDILAEVIERFNWRCYAYCLMTNYYQLQIEIVDTNLPAGMRNLNGAYTQASNRRHKRAGHVFQGRYKAILIDPKTYLLEVARQIVLNPVHTNSTQTPDIWAWSSYRATAGDEPAPGWMHVDKLLRHFGDDQYDAQRKYRRFVLSGVGSQGLFHRIRQQLYLGDEEFVRKVQAAVAIPDDPNIAGIQRRPPAPGLDRINERAPTRNRAIVDAYKTGAYSYTELGKYFGMHPSSIGRIVRPRMPNVLQRSSAARRDLTLRNKRPDP